MRGPLAASGCGVAIGTERGEFQGVIRCIGFSVILRNISYCYFSDLVGHLVSLLNVAIAPNIDKEGYMEKIRSLFHRIFGTGRQPPKSDRVFPSPQEVRQEQPPPEPDSSVHTHFHLTEQGMTEYVEQNRTIMEDYIGSIQLDATSPGSYLIKAGGFAAMKRFEEALRVYEEGIRLAPSDAGGFYLRKGGILAHDVGRLPEALEAFDQAIQLDSTSSEPCIQKAHVLYRQDKYQEALDVLDRAIQRNPRYFLSYLNRGMILDKLGRYEDALLACEQAIQREPDFDETYQLKREILTKLGRQGFHPFSEQVLHRSILSKDL